MLTDRCAAMATVVQEACEHVAHRYALSGPDRDDLEQDVWLTLLTRWREPDQWSRPPIDVPTLARQVGRLLAACQFGCGLREPDALPAAPPRPNADLRIDLAGLLARLSTDDERFCRQWMAENLSTAHPAFPRLSLFDSAYLLALRPAFEAAGLRVYL